MKHPLDLHRSRRMWGEWDRRRAPLGRHRARRRFGRNELAGMLLAGIVGGLAWTMLPGMAGPSVAAPPIAFGFCHSGGGSDCVVDGDTFRMGGERIRIADIDTPETHPPRCAREAELGAAATRRLHALLNGGAVRLHPIDRDTDRYGRKLRTVTVDGRGVGATLIAEGLARPYRGGPRAGWCG
ncbi:thermonuclease family protein [Sphingomonas sp. ST-64]|uniref:Thermonuclease family protein n=1 Tax=Sphingomonas plantiphila TaxID=3163295 RepID=A0ABW8YKS0_9SPHN